MEHANAPAQDRGAADNSMAGDASQHTKITPETLAAIDRASDLDAAWFRRHPDRAYRLRPIVPREHLDLVCPPGRLALTLVKHVRPGVRSRAALWATRRPCGCDSCLDDIWGRMVPAGFRAGLVALAAAQMGART